MATGVYAKGSPLESDKDWYHGELDRVQAEQVLAVFGCDCFLVRVGQGALILSLLHHGQPHHFNIKYGHGRYELDSGSTQHSFTGLEELVDYYSSHPIGQLNIPLGTACKKAEVTTGPRPHQHERISDIPNFETILETSPGPSHEDDIIFAYAKGEPEDLTKHSWYHGNITKQQAEAGLNKKVIDNGFLVRVAQNNLILSKSINGWISHDIIQRSFKGYQLEYGDRIFKSVPEMIAHYQHYPIEGTQMLGTGVATVPSRQKLEHIYEPIFAQEETELKLSWKKCADMPVGISAPQVVKIKDCVYVGGGMGKGDGRIFMFNIKKETWTPLPPCPTIQQGLTTLDSELVAVGGMIKNVDVNIVCRFRSNAWTGVLPPMPTPRSLLSVVSHDNRIIIAAGGRKRLDKKGTSARSDKVEIYIRESQTWFTANPLPFALDAFSMCIISDECYVLGGTTTTDKVTTVLHAAVSSLQSNSTQFPWKQLQEPHLLSYASPVELDRRLVVMGGSPDPMQRYGTEHISMYDFANNTWEVCKNGTLPVPLYRAGVVKLDSNQVMIVGGQPKQQQFSGAVYIGTYKMLKH